MSLVVLTSLSPSPAAAERQRTCLATWRKAGLEVVSLNPPEETLHVKGYGVHVQQVVRTGFATYGRHVVPINEFVSWVDDAKEPALLLNADIELRMTRGQVQHLAELAAAGMPMVARVNHDPGMANARVEPAGFDGFVVSPRHCHLYAESFLSLGQPWWDYWVPWMALKAGEGLLLPREPVAFHLRHQGGWGWPTWTLGAREFARLTGLYGGDDHAAYSRLSATAYTDIAARAVRENL